MIIFSRYGRINDLKWIYASSMKFWVSIKVIYALKHGLELEQHIFLSFLKGGSKMFEVRNNLYQSFFNFLDPMCIIKKILSYTITISTQKYYIHSISFSISFLVMRVELICKVHFYQQNCTVK